MLTMFEVSVLAFAASGVPFAFDRRVEPPQRCVETSAATIAFFQAARAARRAAEREDYPSRLAGPLG